MDVLSPTAGLNFQSGPAPVTPVVPTSNSAAAGRGNDNAPLAAPPEPATLLDSGLSRSEIESLVLKIMLQRGACTGSVISEVACMPRTIVGEALDRIRNELLVTIKSSSGIQDYVYQLTDAGFQRAQQHAIRCNFVGPAPVVFDDYVASIYRQSLQRAPFSLKNLQRALSSMSLQPSLVSQIGQALNDG